VLTSFLLWPLLLACVMVSFYWANLPTVLAYLAIVLVTCLTTATLALFCSVVFRKTSVSLMTSYLLIVVLFAMPLALAFFARRSCRHGELAAVLFLPRLLRGVRKRPDGRRDVAFQHPLARLGLARRAPKSRRGGNDGGGRERSEERNWSEGCRECEERERDLGWRVDCKGSLLQPLPSTFPLERSDFGRPRVGPVAPLFPAFRGELVLPHRFKFSFSPPLVRLR
jgi:hypothetical protein